MSAGKYFQPGPRCGNCRSFSKEPDAYHAGRFCRKALNPATCGTAFQSRHKARKERKIKPWQQPGGKNGS